MQIFFIIIKSILIVLSAVIVSSPVYGGSISAGAASATIQIPSGTIDSPDWGGWDPASALTMGSLETGDSFKATAVVISDGTRKVAIVSVDTLLMYNEIFLNVRDDIITDTGIDNVLIIATHNHSAMNIGGHSTINANIESAIRTAVDDANDNLESASIGYAKAEFERSFNRIVRDPSVPDTNDDVIFTHCDTSGNDKSDSYVEYINDNPDDPLDSDVGIIHIRDSSDETIATLVNYASHSVIYGEREGVHDNTIPSSGYPGKLRRDVESELGGKALFIQGTAGDIDPWCSLLTGSTALSEVNQFGGDLATEVTDAVDSISTYTSSETMSLVETEIHFTPTDVDSIVRLSLLDIGSNMTIATISGEPYVQIGKEIKSTNANGTNSNITFVAGYTNAANGYIPETEYCDTSTAYTIKPEDNVLEVPCDMGDRVIDNMESLILYGSPLPGIDSSTIAQKRILLLGNN